MEEKKELSKKIKGLAQDSKAGLDTKQEIELRELLHGHHLELDKIAELRNDFYSHASLIIGIREVLRDIGNEIVKYFQCDSEVMTEIEGIDLMCNNINKSLEKLDSPKTEGINYEQKYNTLKRKVFQATEKKEDSETLKKIKQLAHAESEFYNKHGYFSFWSDKLKAQRIKEMVLLKHLKDHKKVSEDQRKGIDIKKLFNEFDKANDELIKNLETEKKEVFDNVCICGHTDPAHDPVECKYCDCTEYKKDPWSDYESVFDPIKGEMVTRKKTENKCKICGEKSPNEDGFCSSECFEKAQWESKEKPCNRCDHLIENINKYGHFYCRELDMKMDEFVEKCVHSTPKKKEKDYDLGMITSKDGELSAYIPTQFIKDYAKEHSSFSLIGLLFPKYDSGSEKESSVNCYSEEGIKMKAQCRSNCPFYKVDNSACNYCEDWRNIKLLKEAELELIPNPLKNIEKIDKEMKEGNSGG